jgi:MFS family permease
MNGPMSTQVAEVKSIRGNHPPVPSYGTLLLISCAVAFACYFGSYMRIPVVPLFARSLGATTGEVGMINSAFLLVAGLLSLPLGILSDRTGRKLLVAGGLLISAGTSLLLYFAGTPLQMVAIYLFFGVGLAAFGPTMMSFVADFSPATHLGRSYGWYTTALYAGMSLGPAAGGWVAEHLGFRQVFLISGIFIFLLIWVVLLFLPRGQHLTGARPKQRALAVMARGLLRNRPLLGCWLATLGGCFGLGMFVTFFPLHAHNAGLNVGQIGLVFALQAVFNAFSRIPFGQLSDRVTQRGNLVVAGLIGFAASMVGFALSRSMTQFVLSTVALGLSMGLAFTPLGALISQVVPPDQRGLAMGGYNTCIYFGMMLSAAVMGLVIPVLGFERSFYLTAAMILASTGWFSWMMKGFPAKGGMVGA